MPRGIRVVPAVQDSPEHSSDDDETDKPEVLRHCTDQLVLCCVGPGDDDCGPPRLRFVLDALDNLAEGPSSIWKYISLLTIVTGILINSASIYFAFASRPADRIISGDNASLQVLVIWTEFLVLVFGWSFVLTLLLAFVFFDALLVRLLRFKQDGAKRSRGGCCCRLLPPRGSRTGASVLYHLIRGTNVLTFSAFYGLRLFAQWVAAPGLMFRTLYLSRLKTMTKRALRGKKTISKPPGGGGGGRISSGGGAAAPAVEQAAAPPPLHFSKAQAPFTAAGEAAGGGDRVDNHDDNDNSNVNNSNNLDASHHHHLHEYGPVYWLALAGMTLLSLMVGLALAGLGVLALLVKLAALSNVTTKFISEWSLQEALLFMQFLVNITRLAGSEQDSTHAALSFLLYGGNAVASEVESRALRQFHVELIVRCSRAKGSGWLAAAVQAWTLATPDISRAFIDDPKLREPTAAAPGPSPTANLLLDGAIKPAQATEASERRATHLSVPSSTRSRPPTSP